MNWISIPRPRLVERLRDQAPLTFIYGLPGSGKTHLLREWTQSQDIMTVWLTCSEIDNDPVCFWHHLLHVFDPALHDEALTASPFPSNLEASVIALIAWIEGRPQTI